MPSFGPEVDDVVGGFDDVEIMLDDDDGVAVIDQAVEAHQQPIDVGKVQAGGGLVEDVEIVLAADLLAQFAGELDALRFAA